MEQLGDLGTYILAMRPADLLDVALVGALVFLLLYVLQGTRAVPLIRGMLLLVLAVFLIGQLAQLQGFGYLARFLLPALAVAVPVIFQPEIRRGLERLGRAGPVLARPSGPGGDDAIVTVVSLAARQLAQERHGALIVLERDVPLDEAIDRGVVLDAAASVELLRQIFAPNTPLHDGAVVIRRGRVASAGVVLPLSEAVRDEHDLGTRHLAAQSVTDGSDALAVVVSEETSTISLARGGQLIRHLDESELLRLLYRWYVAPSQSPTERWLQPLWRYSVPGLRRAGAPAAATASAASAADGPGVPAPAAGSKDRAAAEVPAAPATPVAAGTGEGSSPASVGLTPPPTPALAGGKDER
jgi:diadenylate cyclase